MCQGKEKASEHVPKPRSDVVLVSPDLNRHMRLRNSGQVERSDGNWASRGDELGRHLGYEDKSSAKGFEQTSRTRRQRLTHTCYSHLRRT